METLRGILVSVADPSKENRGKGGTYDRLPSKDGDIETSSSPETFQIGRDCDDSGYRLFPNGWTEDFLYYSANNHPLHGIFSCDRFHPLSWIERLMMELATFGMAFFTLFLHDKWVDSSAHAAAHKVGILSNPMVFSLVVVTIPGIIVWWTLFLLFTCKWGIVNMAREDVAGRQRGRNLQCACEAIGHTLVLLGVAFLGLHGLRNLHNVQPVVMGRVKGYVIAWFMMGFVYFNPLVAWGQPNPVGAFCFGDLIGLGQWRIEKQRFQTMCMSGIEQINSELQNQKEAEKTVPKKWYTLMPFRAPRFLGKLRGKSFAQTVP